MPNTNARNLGADAVNQAQNAEMANRDATEAAQDRGLQNAQANVQAAAAGQKGTSAQSGSAAQPAAPRGTDREMAAGQQDRLDSRLQGPNAEAHDSSDARGAPEMQQTFGGAARRQGAPERDDAKDKDGNCDRGQCDPKDRDEQKDSGEKCDKGKCD